MGSGSRSHGLRHAALLLLIICALNALAARALIVVVEEKECLAQHIEPANTITGSFVVLDIDSAWRDDAATLDFTITNPVGDMIYQRNDAAEDNFQFVSTWAGEHKFCFHNKEHLSETVQFDIQIGHHTNRKEIAKDDHVALLMADLEVIAMHVGEIQADQAFFKGQELRARRTSESTRRKLVYYAIMETFILIGASALQVYFLRRMFEKRGNYSRA